MSRITRLILAIAIPLALPLFSVAATSNVQTYSNNPAEGASLNFVDADIDTVVKALGQVTGRNYVLDPRVKGKFNIVSVKPVSPATFFNIVLAALRMQGFTAVERSNYTLILPEVDARQFGGKSGNVKSLAKGENLATQVIPLQFESAAQVLAAIKPLLSTNNSSAAQAAGNSIVVTDYADNLAKVASVIEAIDQPQADEPIMIPLQHAAATDVALVLNRLMADPSGSMASSGGSVSNSLTVLAEPRSNRLIVRTSNPARLSRIRALAQNLDTPGVSSGQIHVVPLKNAEALKLAQTLRTLLAGENPSLSNHPGAIAMAPPSASVAPGTSPTASAPAFPANSNAVGTSSGGSLPGGSSIQADASTNSLIIAAPDAVYRNLRGVIEQLDARRAQIYVEALIAEIDLSKLEEFGFQWQTLSGASKGNSQGIGGTNFGSGGSNILGVGTNPLSVSKGLNIGLVSGTVTIAGQTMLNLGMLARALDGDGKTNILSTPNLLTLDNEEAKIVIGENVPFITGQYAQTGNTATPSPFQTIERKDVGLTLKVKPLITESGTVKLQIYQEVSSVQQGTLNNQAGPSTNKRAIESTVLVDDGQIVALGGLIQDQTDQNIDKVPAVGDVPLLGHLFRYETRQRKRTSLTIFLRPVILRDAASQSAFANARYDTFRKETEPRPSHPVLPDMPTPILPERASSGLEDQSAMPPQQ